jgi:hypothetical protein
MQGKLCLCLIILLLFFCSCGYRFSGGEGVLSGKVQSVSVQIFENKSRWSNLDVILTNDIVAKLRQSRSVNLIPKKLEYVLSGTIERVRVDTLSRSSDGTPQEKYVEITLSAYIVDRQDKKIWQTLVTDREAFFPAQNHALTLHAQNIAMDQISERLADRIMNELGQGF